jgi:hypothetical protein
VTPAELAAFRERSPLRSVRAMAAWASLRLGGSESGWRHAISGADVARRLELGEALRVAFPEVGTAGDGAAGRSLPEAPAREPSAAGAVPFGSPTVPAPKTVRKPLRKARQSPGCSHVESRNTANVESR